MSAIYDVAIIGAGMAGASLAAELAAHGVDTVALLEAEDRPGYHATGRSAAFWEECYGGPDITPLTLASGDYLRCHGFLTRRGALYVGREEDEGAIADFCARFADSGATFTRVDRDAAAAEVPGLRPEWDRGIAQPDCADIDVAGLHQHYLRRAAEAGIVPRCRSRVVALERGDGAWTLTLSDGQTIRSRIIANAAGAWADGIAALAGAAPAGIVPLRRTVVQVRTDPPPVPDQPLVLDISGGFYFRPESGRLWLSPQDETPSDAVDAAPEEWDVALAVERFTRVADAQVLAVERKWAGLRSFARDRLPVYGFDPAVEGFFWFAGQGGYGIQTAPAAARLAAQLFTEAKRDEMTRKLDPARYSPARFI